MARPSRKANISSSQDAEDDPFLQSRRKRQKVNYFNIENGYDDLSSEDKQEDNDLDIYQESSQQKQNGAHYVEEEDDDYNETELIAPSSRHSRTKKANTVNNEEDEDASFNEEQSDAIEDNSESENYSESDRASNRRRLNNFISKDDDDGVFGDDSDYETSRSKSRKSRRSTKARLSRPNSRRSRSRKLSDDEDEDEDDEPNDDEVQEVEGDTIQDELAELRDDSDASPQRSRSLRERKKTVNYAIPPPLSENVEELNNGLPGVPTTPKRRGGGTSAREWRLFPTGGPFGGGSVTSLFGKNYAGSGGYLLGAGGADSDSSDDEIVPVGGTSSKKDSASHSLSVSRSKKKQPADSDPLGVDMNIDFSAVGGLDTYINQLKEMVALPLLYPEVYQRFGITPPRGVLFHGPPGTGKTLMARALAASYSSEGRKITFFMRKGADCLSKWVGEAERQLRLLFEEAKKQQPSIIFFDEIDGLAPVRSSKQEQIHASIVSTMLALMDGMDNRGQVIVIGATNRPDAVDPALRRPGRFDREFYFPLPDLKAREEILTIHTKKWEPPLSKEFISKVAHLTKGYGGADLRALCTEAALNSIQRRYPQIYASNDKLKIDPQTIVVAARDFMKAIDKIIPSSARSTYSGSSPLPEHLTSLLKEPLDVITTKLDRLVPRVKTLSSLEEAQFVDPTENDLDGGFARHEFIKRIETSRVHRPRLLITGLGGNGQQYIGSAVLNHLEGFNIQSIDLGVLYGDSTRTAENAIIQSFIEARRHKPSIIYIPNIDIWYDILPETAKAALAGLLRSVSSNERILLLGVAENQLKHLDRGLKLLFGISDANFFELDYPDDLQRSSFFNALWDSLQMPPNEFLDTKKKKKLEKLEKVISSKEEEEVNDLKSFEKSDMRLKNTLKIKLSGLMDLFRNRYKKFKKPTIDSIFLIHLFEAQYPNAPAPLFTKDGEMIVEISTGKRYFNMDLDIIEERLWNGFYSEPKQFLRDIEMIYLDSVTSNDRERLIKGSEMYANAQVAVEEISTPEFVAQCKSLRQREVQRIQEHEREIARLKVKADNEASKIESGNSAVTSLEETTSVANGLENGETENHMDLDGVVTSGKTGSSPELSVSNGSKDDSHSNHDDVTLLKLPFKTQTEAPQGNFAAQKSIDRLEDHHTSGEVEEEEKEKEEEEEDEEEDEELHPEFELDLTKLNTAKEYLVAETSGLTVEYLEQINAKLMDILWNGHTEWNRNGTLNRIIDQITLIKVEFK